MYTFNLTLSSPFKKKTIDESLRFIYTKLSYVLDMFFINLKISEQELVKLFIFKFYNLTIFHLIQSRNQI
jgi:hypothetical protein